MRFGPHRTLAILVHIVLMVSAIVATGELAAQQKTPVPDAQAQQTARKAAGEIFASRFALAKTAAEKTALATDMIAAAAGVPAGSADQYVLLKIACDVAAKAGDAPTALQAAERLIERFDEPAAERIGETLLTAARQATTSAQHKAVAEAALSIAEKLAEADQHETALRLCEAARLSAQRAKLYPLAKELTAQIEEIKRQQRLSEDYRKALAVLENKPTDPEANQAAGRHLCFLKSNWERGVPMLALGSDAALKAVALQDLRGAASAEEQAAIGDAWWDLAETKQGEERDTLRLRAGFWYRQAEPKLAGGLASLKVKQRLEGISNLGREITTVSHVPPRPNVLVITGEELDKFHDWRVTTPILVEMLQKDPRLRARVVTDPAFVVDASIHQYDVIVFHVMNWPTSPLGPDSRNNLRKYVESGKGLFLIHLACGGWQAWSEFRDLVGRVYITNHSRHEPRGPFRVTIQDMDHPITRGLTPFEADDELYEGLVGDRLIEVLATARSNRDGQNYPIAFTHRCGKGRVYQCLLGHDAKAMQIPGVEELYRRGCAWAAGLTPVPEEKTSPKSRSRSTESRSRLPG